MFAYCFNNPIAFTDDSGMWPKPSEILITAAAISAVVAVAACTVAVIAVSAPVAVGVGVVGVSATACTAMAVAEVAVVTTVVTSASAFIAAVAEETYSRKVSGNHTVYFLVDNNDQVQYVGRTKNPDKREKAHLRNPARADLKFMPVHSGLNAEQARGLEQMYMLNFHTIHKSAIKEEQVNNQINGISPSNLKLSIYMKAAREYICYTENLISNEILYWTGQ